MCMLMSYLETAFDKVFITNGRDFSKQRSFDVAFTCYVDSLLVSFQARIMPKVLLFCPKVVTLSVRKRPGQQV